MTLPKIPKTLALAVQASALQLTPAGRLILKTQNKINDLMCQVIPNVMTESQFTLLQKDAQRIYSEHPPEHVSITSLFVLETMVRHVYEDWSAGKRPFGYEPEPAHKWMGNNNGKWECWLQKKETWGQPQYHNPQAGYFKGGKRIAVYMIGTDRFSWSYLDTGDDETKTHSGSDGNLYITLFMAQRQGLRWYYNALRAGQIQENV